MKPRILVITLFAVYLVLLAWLILWKLEVPYVGDAWMRPRPIKLVPFLPSGDDDASKPLEVLANVVLFIPFGVYLGLLGAARWWKATAVFAGASLVLEITQHLISVGSFDSTDVIVNTVGGVVGLGLLALARRRFSDRVIVKTCLIAAIVCVVAIAIFIASPLHYGPQRDVIVSLP